MWKEIILVLSLFSFSFCQTFAPWHQRQFEYSVSDMCSYSDSIFKYVKPCPVNYSCKSPGSSSNSHGIEICQATYKTVKRFGAKCESDIECDSGLECSSSAGCVNRLNSDVYTIQDKSSGDNVYYCNAGYSPSYSVTSYTDPSYLMSTSPSVFCDQSSKFSDMGNNCWKSDGTTVRIIPPSFGMVCGKINLQEYTSNRNNYYVSNIEMNKMGSLDDGQYVFDDRACKSFFSVPLYRGNTLKAPTVGDTNQYKVCATYKGFEKDNNGYTVLKYQLNNQEFSYNTQSNDNAMYYATQIELFKEFVQKSSSVNCQANQGYDNEQFTCGNDELRRLLYFIANPDKYLLYKNEDSIIDYLLQKEYPDYKSRYSEPVDASGYLNLKFISLLILLLSL